MFPTLQKGDGFQRQRPELRASVITLQQMLGFPESETDGIFGDKTLTAVLKVQYDNELPTTGIVDPTTWNILLSGARIIQRGQSRAKLAVAAARRDLGQREKPGNSGFLSVVFETEMKKVGWFRGAAWCDFAVEKWWKEAFADNIEMTAVLSKMFTGGTLASWRNFSKSPLFKTGKTPAFGALGYYKHSATTGHAVIVSSAATGSPAFRHISGNTNKGGSREGYEVAEKDGTANDKRLLGFVYIPEN